MVAAPSHAGARKGAPVSPALAALLVCLLFALSGSVGLVYEVAWKHIFSTVFGSTTYAVSVVISVFMGGLALGSFVFGKLADRVRCHLLICALLEVGIATTGLLVHFALHRLEPLYRAVFQASQSPALLTAVQVAVSAAVLLVPTFLMGGTLPVLSRFVASIRGGVAPAVGILYGLNTLGAAGGAFVTGFVLVKALGTRMTVYLAASANLGLAAAFLLLYVLSEATTGAGREGAPVRTEEPAAEPPLSRARLRLLLAAVAVSGFAAFSYEVLWTRLLSFRLEATVYAFSIMLTTFLLGLGLGGAVVGLWKRSPAKARYWRAYGYLEAAVGISGLATVLLFFSGRHGYATFAQRVVGELGFSALVMLVPTTLMGAAFPIACHLFAAGVRETGKSVGRIYVFNTCGCVAGALLTGFYLVRVLGTQGSITLASFLMIVSGSTILAWSSLAGVGRTRSLSTALRALRPLPLIGALGIGIVALTPSDFLVRYFLKNQSVTVSNPSKRVSLLGYAEGVEGIVVACNVGDGHKTIAAGSTDVAGTSYVLRNTQKLQAHIPMLIHPDPREVCQIGFGSGETARIFSSYDVARFDCVEISRAMLKVADDYFKDINDGVVSRKNFNAIIMDASAYLRYTDRKYDIIANDATWPSQSGPAMLFTLEYFRRGREHLKPGGMMTSWLPLDMPTQDIKTVLRTFHEVFPHVYIWSALSDRNRHALIAGSDGPLQIDLPRFRGRFEQFARKDLESVYLDDPAVFLACHLSEVEGADRELDRAPLSTDYSPVLRFMYSRMYGPEDMVAGAFRVLRVRRDSILNHLTNAQALPDSKEFLARISRFDEANKHLLRALSTPAHDLDLRGAELARAVALAPELPAARLVAEEGKAMAALTPDRIKALPLPDLKDQARRLMRQGAYDKAVSALNEWAAREPASAEPYMALGTAYMLMQKPQKAVPLLGEAIRLDPHAVGAHFSLGVACVRMGRVAEGIPHLEEAVRLAPESAEAHAYLGTAFGLVDDAVRALPHLQRAVELDPNLADAQCNLGVLLFRAGNHREAMPHLEKSLDLGLDKPGTHRMLAEAYREAGDERGAALHLKAAQEADSKSQQPGTLR